MRKRYYKSFTCLLLLLLMNIYAAAASAGESYTLDHLLNLLKEKNLLLKIAAIDRDIVRQEYRAARALPNPEIELIKGEGELLEGPGNPTVWGIGLKASVPNPFYRFFFLKSLRKDITAAEIEAEIKKKSLVKSLKEHYFHLQYSRKISALLREKNNRLKEVNRITKAKVSIGEAKEIDFLRASVEIQKNQSFLFKMEKIVSSEKTTINELLNFSLKDGFSVVEDFGFAPLTNIESRIDKLIEKSPFVVLKRNDLGKKKDGLKTSRFSLIESLEIFAEREREVEAKLWKLGIGFSIPVFNFKAAEVRKAKYERAKARKEFEHAKKHLFAGINRIISQIRVLEKEIETFTGAVLKEGRENVELSEKLYKEGEIPLVVFLDSQNSYFEIEQRYYEAISEWKILKAGLEELLGEEI